MRNKNYLPYEQKSLYSVREYIDYLSSFGEKTVFVIHSGKTVKEISYAAFVRDVKRCARVFADKGLRGKHIALLGENSYCYFLCFLSAMYAGAAAVPIDAAASPREYVRVLSHSDSEFLLYDGEYENDIKDSPVRKERFEDFCNRASALPEEGGAPDGDTPDGGANGPGAIVYTSGSTGEAKGVMLSQRNIVTNAVATKRHVLAGGSTICVLPLNHTYCFTTSVMSVLLNGCAIHLGIRLSRLEKSMAELRPDFIFFVPVIIENIHREITEKAKAGKKEKRLRMLMRLSDLLLKFGIDKRSVFFKDIRLFFGGKLRWIGCGGAPLRKDIVEDFRSWGIEIICAYGLTECSPGVASNRNDHNIPGTVGTVISGCEIKINGENGVPGEIYVKGDNVMSGYYKDEAATKEAFDGEWFRTGDLGVIDKNGVLTVTGRKKNLIILSNGKNVSPEELENVLSREIPEIKEVVVYAENNEIAAEILPRRACGENGIKQALDRVNETLPYYKKITVVRFRETEFPKTTTKKIRREGDRTDA